MNQQQQQRSSSSYEPPSEVTPLVRATESSMLTQSDPEITATGNHRGNGNATETPIENDFDHFVDASEDVDELNRPWPATFDRSISLLAGPIRDVHYIEEITKSPKIITPNIRDRRRVSLWNILHTLYQFVFLLHVYILCV